MAVFGLILLDPKVKGDGSEQDTSGIEENSIMIKENLKVLIF
jgi:hypothetical protein